MVRLRHLAKVIRSKNAGPLYITFDVMFDSREAFDRVRRSGVISPELMARLYGVPPEQVVVTEYQAANAIKATVPRRVASGCADDTDVYGTQQHVPLLDVEVP